MIYLYLFSLVVGGGLLGVSILLGGHADTDASGPEVHMDSPPQSVGHDEQMQTLEPCFGEYCTPTEPSQRVVQSSV